MAFDEADSRLDLCGRDRATEPAKYCSNLVRFLIRPSCECTWQVSACGNHLAEVLRAAAQRDDPHRSKDWLLVAPLFFGRQQADPSEQHPPGVNRG